MAPLHASLLKLSSVAETGVPVADVPVAAAPARVLARKPVHLAVILDGNGRWATAKGLPRLAGHVKGVESVRETVGGCLDHGIRVLTLYAFSTLNWKRPDEEVGGLMNLFRHYLEAEVPRLHGLGVAVRGLGDRERLSADVADLIDRAEAENAPDARMVLNLAVNYGGREELVHAVKSLAGEVAGGKISADEIDVARVEGRLYTRELPPVDLVIRTAGERRLSNFLLWQSAYAELYFTETLWPDFSRANLEAALLDFATRKRTFGGLVDQARP
ncbi:MAG: di-trans,poly-cis-decaprenylcistransferase [Planctomycetota bacterium]|nr:di-trans,poly-cis-decaprenylcistransferase [Planctomycetota bacterium]